MRSIPIESLPDYELVRLLELATGNAAPSGLVGSVPIPTLARAVCT